MKEPLVSIITPCYNGEKTIKRMMDSVLGQSYGNIEYILVNDGSTDGTEMIALSLREQFERRGYRFLYVQQENGGLGAAINAGLKVFSGEYLCWADADDFFAPQSVEKRVRWMEEHPDFGVVASDAYTVSEDDMITPLGRASRHFANNNDENQFWHLLDGESIFCCGCHMVRTSCFLEVNPSRQIFPTRRGQNWQMLLPLYYKYKRGYLDEPLYFYVVGANSMSKDNSIEQVVFRCDEHEDILLHTLDQINMPEGERESAKCRVHVNYAKKKLSIAFRSGKRDLAEEQVEKLKQYRAYNLRCRLYSYGAKHDWFRRIVKRRL